MPLSVNGVLLSAYKICKERGHTASGKQLLTSPPLDICKHCSMPYRFETTMIELYGHEVNNYISSKDKKSVIGPQIDG